MTTSLDIKITVPILGQSSAFTPAPLHAQEVWSEPETLADQLSVQVSLSSSTALLKRKRQHQYARFPWATLAWQALNLETIPENTLIAPQYLASHWRRTGVVPYHHQLSTAERVIIHMGGRAILADEVGLGKTIEAGLILKEYILRGQVQKALILCPAALIWQWYQELKDKFLISAGIQRTEYDWERSDILIASLDTAKRNPHADILKNIPYDIVILDEAHRVKNERTHNYRFIQSLSKTYKLLLTATPVQNDLRELYNLVHLVSPGMLGTYRQFRREHMEDRRTVRHPQALRSQLERIIVRNRRGPETVELTPRHVQFFQLDPLRDEWNFYQALEHAFSGGDGDFSADRVQIALTRILLLREACSSGMACAVTLQRLAQRNPDSPLSQRFVQLAEQAQSLTDQIKLQTVLNLVQELDDQVIIFTEYRATQAWLLWKLQQRNIPAMGFSGDLSASRKEWTKELFRRHGRVLVSTESGGEGLNFQFCCHVINYDLPWNPMKLEQRIGRIHRLGQTRPVHVYNLTIRGTIEEHIMYLLQDKIRLFEMAVGELDDILAGMPIQRSLEDELSRILAEAGSPGEVRRRLDELAIQFDSTRESQANRPTIDDFLSPS